MNELIDMINKMEKPVEGFNLLNYKNKWWGVGKNGEIVYGIDLLLSILVDIFYLTILPII